APIKYVIYSHNHFDHVAGGQPFKDLGATFVAHRNAKAKIAHLNAPDVVVPDEVVDDTRSITLGGTTIEFSMSAKTTPTARWSCGYQRKRSYSRSIGFRCKRFPFAAWPIPTCLISRMG